MLSFDSVLVSACSGKQLYIFELGDDIKNSVSEAVPKWHDYHSAAILSIDFHPTNK